MSIALDALGVLEQVRTNIAPGASGWAVTGISEAQALNELIQIALAQLEIGGDVNSPLAVQVQNFLYARMILGLPGNSENGVSRGQVNAMLVQLNASMTVEIADD